MVEEKADVSKSAQTAQVSNKPKNRVTKAELALGLSIAALIFAFIPLLDILGFIFTVIAIVFASISLSKEKTHRGQAIAGLVIGIVSFVIGILMLIGYAGASSSLTPTNNTEASSTVTTPSSTPTAPTTTPTSQVAPTRQPQGTATTLGAGSFVGGKDVTDGLYDVTTTPGQSGNFMVSGTDTYNEILGRNDAGGVDKIRVKISDGDQIEISSLSTVIFTPVTSPFVTTSGAVSLYAGTFVVGQDIGAGRYTVTPGSGESGNFMVDGADSYNEILGPDPTYGQVPSLTINLTDGDTITISSMDQVNFAPAS